MENIDIFKDIIAKAYNKYVYNTEVKFSNSELTEFADYMINKIFS